jgi:hypothetical protein
MVGTRTRATVTAAGIAARQASVAALAFATGGRRERQPPGRAVAACTAASERSDIPETLRFGARASQAECELELGARELLEALIARQQELDPKPGSNGTPGFVLARALWALGDSAAARSVAGEAERAFITRGPGSAKQLAALRAWRTKVGIEAE